MAEVARAGRTRWRPRLLIAVLVAVVAAIVIGANAHLVYVATVSQPECVPHLKSIDTDNARFRAAKSAC